MLQLSGVSSHRGGGFEDNPKAFHIYVYIMCIYYAGGLYDIYCAQAN